MSVKKTLRNIIVAIAAIIVCAAAVLIVTKVAPNTDSEPSPSPTAAPESKNVLIVKEDPEQLTRLLVERADGQTFSVDYSFDENGKLLYTPNPQAEYFAYNTSKFRSIRYTVSSLSVKELVTETPGDLAVYGLDEPQATITLTYGGRETYKVYIGKGTPVGRDYFAKTDKSDAVYVMGYNMRALLMRTALDYRQISSFPKYEDEDIYANIDSVRIDQPNGTVISIIRDVDNPSEGNTAGSFYYMTSPVESSCADDIVAEQLMQVVAQVNYAAIDRDINRDELAVYGFDKPTRLAMTDVSGNSLDIVVGKSGIGSGGAQTYCADYDQYLACVENNEPLTLLLYDSAAFVNLNISYLDLMMRSAWLCSIENVSTITYTVERDMVYSLKLSQKDAVNSVGVDYIEVTGDLNGRAVSENNTRRLFARTLSLRIAGEIPTGTELGEPEHTV
ncbi:MAG: DUF4340 domain-containing protein, partial [Oscillospiraceae bacterium]|nr:DUF4340 domain-containing protein [Oscillospiraceae bacterium]